MGGDGGGGFEVGDGARDFEDAVVGAGAEIELVHGGAQEFQGIVVELAVDFERLAGHPGVAGDGGGSVKALLLDGAGGEDAFANGGGGLGGVLGGEFLEMDGGDFHMDVDAVEQRAGDALAVALDLHGGAAALAFEVAKEPARTWMRCLFVR